MNTLHLRDADLLKEGGYEFSNISLVHHKNQLRAHKLFERDTDYIVKDTVIIIDEFTGRMMDGRRYSGFKRSRPKKKCTSSKKTRPSVDYIPELFRMYLKFRRHDVQQ